MINRIGHSLLIFVATFALLTPYAVSQTDPVEIPETPAGDHLQWYLQALSGDWTELTTEVIEQRVSPEFLVAVPASSWVEAIQSQATLFGGVELMGFEGEPTPSQLVAIIRAGGVSWLRVTIITDPEQGDQLTTMAVESAPELDPDLPDNWAAFETAYRGVADEVSFLAAELIEGECQPVYAIDSERVLDVASAFKLYILAALATQVNSGAHTWDEMLAITEEWKVTPTGEMQHELAGSEFSLRQYADAMISISDNTATDHLMRYLGRENVEAMIVESGHNDPDRTLPLLLVQEVVVLSYMQSAGDVQRFIESEIAERRSFLETELVEWNYQIGLMGAMMQLADRRPEIGWFASAQDLCNAMSFLHELSGTPGGEPITAVLSINPGTQFDTDVWTYIGYKGGSGPGVLNFTWLLQRYDGRWFVVSAGFNSPEGEVPIDQPLVLLQSAFQLLAEQE